MFPQGEVERRIWERDLLPARVGSPLSVLGLCEDLHVDHRTAERWLQILEHLYVCFRLSPYDPPRVRAVKKERTGIPRFYQTHLGDRPCATGRITALPFVRLCAEIRLCWSSPDERRSPSRDPDGSGSGSRSETRTSAVEKLLQSPGLP